MLKLFKKSFCILCEEKFDCPSLDEIHNAIAKHCEENGYSCEFTGDAEVVIRGIQHEIICKRSVLSRGHFVIKCREK